MEVRNGDGLGRSDVDAVVVLVESLIEPDAPLEHDAADDGTGAIAGRFEALGDGARHGRQWVHAVEADAEVRGVTAGQDGGVRRVGQRRVGRGIGKPDPLRGQAVQHRRPGGCVAVRPEAIGAKGVDGDEQHVRRDRLRSSGDQQASEANTGENESRRRSC